MASWNELLFELGEIAEAKRPAWLQRKLHESLRRVSDRRATNNVLLYASAFLQKPDAPSAQLALDLVDINGVMSVIHQMKFERPITIILHTPGGSPNAAETIHDYLRNKFDKGVEVVVPTFAMSAGTMLALGSDRIIMGRQSQLGPIDPQMAIPSYGQYFSAKAIVDQFDRAKKEIAAKPSLAHAWYPILQSIGPALIEEARNALRYGEEMVEKWLAKHMLAGESGAAKKARAAARHFNDANVHKSHGRRIDRDEARRFHVVVEDLEGDQQLQDAVLTAYHLATLVFEHTPVTKLIAGSNDRLWMKNFLPREQKP